LNERLSELFSMLEEIQSVEQCPNHSKREKRNYHRLAQSLAFGIEQIQWALGLREYTVVDSFKEHYHA
jgi:hypothetical protein